MTKNTDAMVKNTDAKAKNTDAKAIVSDAKAFARLFSGEKERQWQLPGRSYSFSQRADGLPQMISNILAPASTFLQKNCGFRK